MEEFIKKNGGTLILAAVLGVAVYASRFAPAPAVPADTNPQVVERIVEVIREVPAKCGPFLASCPRCLANFYVTPGTGQTGKAVVSPARTSPAPLPQTPKK